MAIDKPQQRIPLGTVVIQGKEYPVTITTPYYKVLFSFFNALGGAQSASVPDLDAGLQYDVREAEAAELAKRVADIERDSDALFIAHIAELQKRINDLETELGVTAQLTASMAQMQAQINDLQTETGTFVA